MISVEVLEERFLLSATALEPFADGCSQDEVSDGFWYVPPDFEGDTSAFDDDDGGALVDGADTNFVLGGYQWPQPSGDGSLITITYSFANLLDGGLGGSLSAGELRAAVEEALGLWSTYAPLNFVEVADSGPSPSETSYNAGAYPQIRFGHHYIDGGSGANVLAHAYYPYGGGLGGDVHYDSSNTWTNGPFGGIDFLEVTVHEIGHSLGVAHESVPSSGGNNAIMNPYYGGRFTGGLGSEFLLQDDINAIRAIYGTGSGSVTALASGGDDHADSAGMASSIGAGATRSGEIEVGGDTDFFAFAAVAGTTYIFETSLGTLPDSVLRLYGQDGSTQIAFDDDSGSGTASRIQWTASDSTTVYLAVEAFDSSQTGTYSLSANVVDDHGNTTGSATIVSVGSSLGGIIETGGDTDWFAFQAVAGESYTFSTSLGTLSDTTLTLYDQKGSSTLQFDDDGGPGLASEINWSATSTGTYYLEVQAYSGTQTGSYTLDLTRIATVGTPTALTPAGTLSELMPTFSWTAVVGAQSYELEVYDVTSGSSRVIHVTGLTGTSYTATSQLTLGNTYQWQVRAVDNAGDAGVWSNSPSFVIQPGTSTLLSSSGTITDHTPTIMWTAAALADTYEVLQYDVTTGINGVIASGVATNSYLVTTSLQTGHSYTFYVRGMSSSGVSGLLSNALSFTVTFDTPTLGSPSGQIQDPTPTFQWSAVDGAARYDLTLENVDTGAVLYTVSVAGTSYSQSSPIPQDTNYRWRVRASASDGTSGTWSSYQSFIIVNSTPVIPTIADQTIHYTQDTLTINLSATDADGDAINYSVALSANDPLASLAYQVDQQLGLSFTGSYSENWGGAGERWMISASGAWHFITPDGNLYRWTGASSGANFVSSSAFVASFDSSYHTDPGKLHNAQAPGSGGLAGSTASIVGSQLVVNPGSAYLGTLQVTVTSSDGFLSDTETFTVTVTNTDPDLNIADQTISHTQDTLTINLPATDADGDALSYTVGLSADDPLADQAYQLDQQLGLYFAGSYSENWGGAGERWMISASGAWHFITSDGNFYRWTGVASGANFVSGSAFVASFDSRFHADPSKLHDAPAVSSSGDLGGSTASIVGQQLVVDPGSGFLGSLQVTVTADDGLATDMVVFMLDVTNTAPNVQIADQSISHTQDTLTVNLPATDADGETIAYTVGLSADDPLADQAYQLDQQLGLYFAGSYSENWGGAGEKWMSSASGAWYFITPDGNVHRWTGARAGSNFVSNSAFVASFDSSYHSDPSKLHNAPAPGSGGDLAGSTASIVGNQLVVDPGAAFLGNLQVTVTGDDGMATDTDVFTLSVTNAAPSIQFVDQSIPQTQDMLTINLAATDADGDAVSYTVGLSADNPLANQAYQLDQQLGLYFTGSYSENWGGAGEKWMSSASGAWYFITADGNVYRWSGARPGGNFVSGSVLVASFDSSYHATPTKLHDAPAPISSGDLAGSTASIVGNQLVIDPGANFVGDIQVTVTADDGITSTTAVFTVSVTAGQSSLAETQSAPDSHVLYVNFDGASLSYDELVRLAGDDWGNNLDNFIDPERDGVQVKAARSGSADRELYIAQVLSLIQRQLDPFGVQVERHTGGAVEGVGATTVFVGDVNIAGAGGWLGMSSDVDVGNDNSTDVVFALPVWIEGSLESSALATSNLILHEAGHSWGLSHVDAGSTAEIMGLGYSDLTGIDALLQQDAAFFQQSFSGLDHHNHGHDLESQSSYQTLMQVFSESTRSEDAPCANVDQYQVLFRSHAPGRSGPRGLQIADAAETSEFGFLEAGTDGLTVERGIDVSESVSSHQPGREHASVPSSSLGTRDSIRQSTVSSVLDVLYHDSDQSERSIDEVFAELVGDEGLNEPLVQALLGTIESIYS